MPRKNCLTRVRSRGKRILNIATMQVPLFAYAQSTEKWADWIFRTVNYRKAEQMVALGEAERITRKLNGTVQVVGYRCSRPTSWERPSPTTLTYGTMIAVGNADSNGREVAERHKLTRGEQRQIDKFHAWPLVGDTKAVAVRPKISGAEWLAAMKMLYADRRLAA